MEIKELTQKHVEDFSREIPKDMEELKIPQYRGVIVRAAIKAGWFVDALTVEQVDTMKPKDVRLLFEQVTKVYADAMEVSPS